MMSHQVPPNAQGELQGAAASLYSLSSIIGPPLLTQILSYFSGGSAPVYFPGAAFFTAATLATASAILFARATQGMMGSSKSAAGADAPADAE
jgi:DHA1 family tetracycline resistance protein-like MFS transporter